jgi:ATP-dependent helicase YprA (DUF1998 family)
MNEVERLIEELVIAGQLRPRPAQVDERRKIDDAIKAGEARGWAVMALFVGVDERTLRRAYDEGVPEVRAVIKKRDKRTSQLLASPYDVQPRVQRGRGQRDGAYVADPGELMNLIPLFMDRVAASRFQKRKRPGS